MNLDQNTLARWRRSPAAFIEDVLRDAETAEPFILNRAERRFLKHAFKRARDGRLLHPESLYSCPKKSGKTTFAAMIMLYVVLVLGGTFAEGYAVANDFEQAQGRVFQAVRRIVEASPDLVREADITANKITFPATGATITALASDYASAAGSNPTITVFDELWAYASERARRLWDEMIPSPAREVSLRLTVTYAGFEGEGALLEELHKRGLEGDEVGPDLRDAGDLLMFWTHDFVAPWQTPEWREQMRRQLRPNAFLRMIENRFVSGEETFIDLDLWDACVDGDLRRAVADPDLPVWLGVDASTKRDSTAIVAVTFEDDRVRLVAHRVFQPTPDNPIDFEGAVEATVLDYAARFRVEGCHYDPYQMAASAQRLAREGVNMQEFPQSLPNLTAASANLYELIKGRGLRAYPDDDVRLAVQRTVAVETPRGWRVTKSKASHRIDVVVALAMAALAAVREGARAGPEDLDGARFFGESEALREARAGDLDLVYLRDERASIFDAAVEAEEFGGTFLQEVRNAIDFEEY